MNPLSNSVSEVPVESQGIAPPAISGTRPLYWSVRRELWENRSIYLAPLIVAAVVLFAVLISTMTLPRRMNAISTLDSAKQRAAVTRPYSAVAGSLIMTAFVVGVFYCLDALHGERRDRSILFWKSLPVSDLTTVLSKASIPLVVLPLLAFAIIITTQLLMLLLSTAVLMVTRAGVATLWTQLPFVQNSLVLLYGLAVHALWHAPLYAWLLLVSVWARRTPLLWAVLPPFALCAFEGIVFQTSHFAAFMKYRVAGAMKEAFDLDPKGRIIHLEQLDPLGFLTSAGLWLGLAAAALFLAVAVRLRRYREPI
jgi:ABC-2 type transport system permease protein